jgi:ubiquinone/menaquinone biosynthesis C-methylase UbiE
MDPEAYEQKYVHDVYNKIASEFDLTRGNNHWKSVTEFINSTPETDIIGDICCGNGKYMRLNPKKFKGCDISDELIKICTDDGLDCIKGNLLDIPFIDDEFDHVICIAALHHLSTKERRLKAINELIRICKKSGKIFIQVWALEQTKDTGKIFTEQESLIPWHTRDKDRTIVQRYYHLFVKDELEELVSEIPSVKIIESFFERGNWGIIFEKI